MSYIGTDRSIWPRVTSLYAHDIVQTAFEMLPLTDRDSDMLESHHVYRAWLATKLHDSRLSELLPGGTDLLPDFYEALPAWQRPLALFSKPRSYPDLVRHVVSHLDWYLEPGRRAALFTLRPVALLLVLALIGGSVTLLAALFGPFALLVLGLMLPVSLLASLEPYRHMHRDINAEEFYTYIKQAYADPTDYSAGFDLSELAAEHRLEAAREPEF